MAGIYETKEFNEYLGIPSFGASKQFKGSAPSNQAAAKDDSLSPILMPDEVDSDSGAVVLGGLPGRAATTSFRMAGDVWGLQGETQAAKTRADTQAETAKIEAKAAEKAAQKKNTGGFLNTVGQAVGQFGGTLLAGALLCDERLKWDMAPLRGSDVNDALAELAFTVKAIRERA